MKISLNYGLNQYAFDTTSKDKYPIEVTSSCM